MLHRRLDQILSLSYLSFLSLCVSLIIIIIIIPAFGSRLVRQFNTQARPCGRACGGENQAAASTGEDVQAQEKGQEEG